MRIAQWTARLATAGTLALALASPASPAGAATSDLATSTDPTWQTNGRVTALVTIGRTTYLGGTFTSVRPAGSPAGSGEVPRTRLAAVDAVTGALLPWEPAADRDVLALAASPDGSTVYVGGMFGTIGGQARKRVAAVSASTGAVTAFAPSVTGRVTTIATSGTRVFLGGVFSTVAGVPRGNLAAVDPAGAVVPEWDPVADDAVRSVAVAPDGRAVYVGGDFGTIDGNTRQKKLAKLTATTGSIQPFSQRPGWPVWSVAVTEDSVFVGGNGSGGHAARFTTSGTQVWVVQTDGGVQAVTPLAGVLYVGGHFDKVCVGDTSGATTGFRCPNSQAERHKLLAVDGLTGTLDAWAPNANSPLGVFALGNGAGRLQAGGDFTRIGVPYSRQQGFAQFSGAGASPLGRASAGST